MGRWEHEWLVGWCMRRDSIESVYSEYVLC